MLGERAGSHGGPRELVPYLHRKWCQEAQLPNISPGDEMHQHGCPADLGFKKPYQPDSHGQTFSMGSLLVSQLLFLGMLPLPDEW